jgi:hypothetical protein
MQDSHNNIVGSKPILLAQKFSDFAATLLADNTSFLPINLDRVGTNEWKKKPVWRQLLFPADDN